MVTPFIDATRPAVCWIWHFKNRFNQVPCWDLAKTYRCVWKWGTPNKRQLMIIFIKKSDDESSFSFLKLSFMGGTTFSDLPAYQLLVRPLYPMISPWFLPLKEIPWCYQVPPAGVAADLGHLEFPSKALHKPWGTWGCWKNWGCLPSGDVKIAIENGQL